MQAADTPFIVNWFENPRAVARALGLDIELPDIGNCDPDYWTQFDRHAWRRELRGKVDMTAEEIAKGDPDWIRLKRLEGGIEVWFDLEEGIRFRCRAAEVPRVASIIRQLAALDGLNLWIDGLSAVIAHQAVAGGGIPYGDYFGFLLKPGGFRWDGVRWTMSPGS